MALEHWSSSASGNASPPGINYAEGQAPSSLNNSAREMMAQVRAKYYATEWVWIKNSATASVASQTTVKVAGNQTAQFEANRRVRLTGGSATRYASVTSASFTTETTVTIVVDSGSLSASMSVVAISAVDQNATPAAAGVAYLTSNSASVMIAAAAMLKTGGVFTGPVGFSATASFSGAAQFNAGVSVSGAFVAMGAATFKASASFSNSVHFRAAVDFSATASFGGSVKFASSASFSGSVNFAGSINVSATASVGALKVAGVAFTATPGLALLGTASFPANSIRFSGSWSDYAVLEIQGLFRATSGLPLVSVFSDGGTTPFLSVGISGTSATFSNSNGSIEVRALGNGSARKAVFVRSMATSDSPQLANFSATANSGFINAIEVQIQTSVTLSSGLVYLYGWRA